MNKKVRIQIPSETSNEILFQSDRTCCVCNFRGKHIQIHHIDENPSNNEIDNLAVLCLDCHNDTMIHGGFGRKLNSGQIVKYNEDWKSRVKERKENADKIASIRSVTGSNIALAEKSIDSLKYKSHQDSEILLDYLEKIIIIKEAQELVAETRIEGGDTFKRNQACSDLIAFYEEVLIELSTFYPKGHFEGNHPKDFFGKKISSAFKWSRLVSEPGGAGTGGTILGSEVALMVIDEIKDMILSMVEFLVYYKDLDDDIDLDRWIDEWIF